MQSHSNKYTKNDLNVHVYGHGRSKKFIIYTDYNPEFSSPRWNKRVYPDIEGNKTKAVKQALKWLNDWNVPSPWVSINEGGKIAISYGNHNPPSSFYETDEKGNVL